MNNNKKCLLTVIALMNLSSCMVYEDRSQVYPTYTYDNRGLYPNASYGMSSYGSAPVAEERRVSVPDSYHVGEYHSPVSFKDRDRDWVANQNPQGYTIEVAEGDKASQVANALQSTPKNDRMAQIKSNRNGQNYYQGVYGSYSDRESAQKALEALPADLKQKAMVKDWSSIQNSMQ